MGLELVELLLEIEKTFDISIPDAEANACETPRQVIDLVCSKLHVDTATTCPRQRAFYLLRSKLAQLFRVPRNQIKPSTSLSSIIPSWNQDDAGIRLRDALGAKVWPSIPKSGCWPRIEGSAVAGICLLVLQANWKELRNTYWGLCAIVVLILFVAMGCLLVIMGAPSGAPLKWHSATLRDLVPYVETSDEFGWTREKVAQTLKLIIMEQFWVPADAYHEDARWKADFNMD